ncbi:MAG: hypothetical protein BWY71_02022 [Planctomycetes bacterium ADurb.Bin412]|nr:MAG: hypothetical protein BWY71_02022 [Planctomycetes bacterium ADurb.Bin412]
MSHFFLFGQPLGQGQHQQQGGRSRGMGQGVRGVKYRHVIFRAGVQIDFVITRPGSAYHYQILRPPGKGRCFQPGTEYYQAIRLGNMFRFDLERIQPAPIARIAGGRGLVPDKIVFHMRQIFVQAQPDVAISHFPGFIQIIPRIMYMKSSQNNISFYNAIALLFLFGLSGSQPFFPAFLGRIQIGVRIIRMFPDDIQI